MFSFSQLSTRGPSSRLNLRLIQPGEEIGSQPFFCAKLVKLWGAKFPTQTLSLLRVVARKLREKVLAACTNN